MLASVLLLILMIAAGAVLLSRAGPASGGDEDAPLVLGQRTKTEGCALRGSRPDPDCTPGAVIAGVGAAQICERGYARSVRDVSVALKRQVYAEYGTAASSRSRAYEVDHLVSLELGGSNDIANLWPEAAEPRPGFHEKDRYEDYLHDEVCSGRISLVEAQRRIAADWERGWEDAGRP
jgi:hypothetical protein